MTALIMGLLFIMLLLLMLNFPSGFKRLMATICFQDEDAIPEYPIGEAVPLILGLVWFLVIPGIWSQVGVTRVETGMNRGFLMVVAIMFVMAGLGLAVSPEQISRTLRWPQMTSTLGMFVSRLDGAGLMIGGAWLLRYGIE